MINMISKLFYWFFKKEIEEKRQRYIADKFYEYDMKISDQKRIISLLIGKLGGRVELSFLDLWNADEKVVITYKDQVSGNFIYEIKK